METLIGLLLLLLPAIFKVVEKKLNASGKAGGKGVAPAVAADEEDADEPEEIASGPLGFPAGTLEPEVDRRQAYAACTSGTSGTACTSGAQAGEENGGW